jgi:hypothetical protein
LSEKKSEHKNEVLRFGASKLVATKAEEQPLIEHKAGQIAREGKVFGATAFVLVL